jgi:hypothetical protein
MPGPAAPRARLYLEAAALYAAWEIAGGWADRHLAGRLPASTPGALMAELLDLALAVGLAVVFGRALGHRDWPPARARGWAASGGSAAATLLLLGLLAGALRLFDPSLDVREFAARGLGSPAALRLLLLSLPLGVAAEEVLFRAAQEKLRAAIGPQAAAAAVATCFALYHVTGRTGFVSADAEVVVAIACGGWLLARLYEVSGRLGLLIATHLAYDYLAIAQGWLNVEQRRPAEAGLFAAWLGGSALLAWGCRRSHGREPGVRAAPARPALGAAGAILFGLALPLAVKWIRWSL